ncbi:T9SS type A sorting domain-containing protein [candidate division KSB1 bacterium]|nr:T9SS type A sorting domain-containing protein [candidate division KSB1 bacterium]
MHSRFMTGLMIFVLAASGLAQNAVPTADSLNITLSQLKRLAGELGGLTGRSHSVSLRKPTVNDLVIGETDPDEQKVITGFYRLDGDLIILNNGILRLDSADFYINGDINIYGHGQLIVSGGSFTVIQEFIYEHTAVIAGKGAINLTGVDFTSSGQSWSIGMAGVAVLELRDSEISDGFLTTALLENSRANIVNTKTPGEFLCFHNNDVTFKNSDFLLMWLVLPDSSVVETSLPDDSLVVDWRFSDSQPGISGIDYSASIDSCTNVLWGLISISGSEAVFTDSDFRAAGLMFMQPDSVVVENLTNGSDMSDHTLDLPDRTLRFVNSSVATWNLYASAESRLTVQNCVFGELLAQDSSSVTIDNSVCDGTGGYIGAFHQSTLIIFRSLITTQTISRQRGILVSAVSALWGTEIDADEDAAIALLNTVYQVEPQAHNNAVIFEQKINHVDGLVDDMVPIPGTVRLIPGPLNPLRLERYTVEYAKGPYSNTLLWLPTDGSHYRPVVDDTLAIWDTHRLSAGNHLLKLTLYNNYGDSLYIESGARLNINTLVKDVLKRVGLYSLEQNYPNPFNPETSIQYELEKTSRVELTIYNALGEEIVNLVDREQIAGPHRVTWDGRDYNGNVVGSGVYFYQLQSEHFSAMRKMILVR